MREETDITVVGGGFAGCESAWQLAQRGFNVALYEMRPFVQTPAHSTGQLAEVVCSNSFGGEGTAGAAGILKAELELGQSLILECAHVARVPAGGALAVDRDRFAALVSGHIESHPKIRVFREEAYGPPEGPAVVATGPLTSQALASSLRALVGGAYFSFFDAVAPIVTRESVDMEKAYAAGRYGQDDDYINCPLDREEYGAFHEALLSAERALPHDCGTDGKNVDCNYFEGCMPVEVLASRGVDTLRFGPMKPVGLTDPRTGQEPYAVVQLRRDNREGTLYNLVGFQTGLKWGEQSRVLKKIPGLENADIARFGVMHRNIYVNAPVVLDPHLRLKGSGRDDLFLAGQITGVEGYMESTAMGLVTGVNAAALLRGGPLPVWPRETAIGSLLHYLQDAEAKTFQPMNANLGLFPALNERIRDKKARGQKLHDRALAAARNFWNSL